MLQIMTPTKQDIFDQLNVHKSAIQDFGTKRLGLFGSFVRNEQTENSDIDLVVDFEIGKKKYKNFVHLAYYLEELFGKKVELVTIQSLAPFVKNHIEKEIEYVAFAN